MADDKLKTGPESPGSDSPGDAPVEKAPETTAPEKVVESGASQASPPEQSVLPGIGGDAPARTAPGEVVVDFDKINELMSQRRAAAREAVSKAEAPAAPEGSPKHRDEAFRDLFGNEEKPPWEKSLDDALPISVQTQHCVPYHIAFPVQYNAVVFVFAHISSENVQTKANSYICGGFLLPFGKIGY